MIFIDPRRGSGFFHAGKDRGFHDLFARRTPVIPTASVQMPGDVGFMGNGPDGDEWVGVEIKTWDDFISSIESGRSQRSQMEEFVKGYDYRMVLVYGTYRISYGGIVEIHQGGRNWRPPGRKNISGHVWVWDAIVRAAMSFQRAGASVHFVPGSNAVAARTIAAWYDWWNTPWEKHSTLRSVAGLQSSSTRDLLAIGADASFLRSTVAGMPLIGWDRSAVVEQHFPSVRDAANADVQDWLSIPGIGPTIASESVRLMQEPGATLKGRKKP